MTTNRMAKVYHLAILSAFGWTATLSNPWPMNWIGFWLSLSGAASYAWVIACWDEDNLDD